MGRSIVIIGFACAAFASYLPAQSEPDSRMQADGTGWRLDRATITDPHRPRVLLIGDSILNGYLKSVTRALAGKAYVDAWVNPYHQASPRLHEMLAGVLENGPYTVIHINMGLHGWQKGRLPEGQFEALTKAYIGVIRARAPKAALIWATSTPVTKKDKPGEFDPEINPVIVEHNRLSVKVMRESNVPVNGLYALLAPRLELARGDQFHWTAPAYEILAKAVADAVWSRAGNRIDIEIGGKPFTTFYYGPDAPKPYLHPLRSASGKIVTRRFPMEDAPEDGTTDKHHRGLWMGYGQINGFNFWENEFSYNNPKAGRVVARSVAESASGISGKFAWLSPSGEEQLEESRTMTFRAGDAGLRTIDFDIELKAASRVTFGDGKDGFFSIRVAEALNERHTGQLLNSNGGHKMAGTWGKTANWVDYSGVVDGERVGIAMFAHPSSFHSPPRWHVRDYGLLASNPFGSNSFDKQAPVSAVTLVPGEIIRLRYRVVIHPAMEPDALEKLYRSYSGE